MNKKKRDRTSYKKQINFQLLFSTYIENLGNRKKVKCIFHSEKNPSLSIDTTRGLFYCFSCGAKGNYWDFLKRVEPETETKILMEKYYV